MSKYVFFLFLIFLSPFVIAQETMTLEKAIAIGLENNFDIKIAEKNIQVAQNNNSWARVGKYPTVDLQGSFNNTMSLDNLSFFLRDPYYQGGLGVNVNANWVVLDGGRIQISKNQLEQAVQVELLNQKTAVHDLLQVIVQNYYAVLLQQERLSVIEESLQLSQDRLKYEEVKKEFGASNSFNLIQFENAILSDSTDLINQENQIDIAKRTLYNTLDFTGFENYTFTERLATQIEAIDEQKLKQTLSEENYTLKSLQMIAEVNALNTKLEKTSKKPTVSLNGSVGVTESLQKIFGENPNTGENFKFLAGERINGSINAVASWNLYDGGVRDANIQNAQIQEEISQMNMLQAKAELINQLDILIANYENQKTVLEMVDKQLQVAQRNISLTEERFKTGQITSLDFQTVQNQYLNVAFSKVNAIYNLILTKSDIDYLVGKFGE